MSRATIYRILAEGGFPNGFYGLDTCRARACFAPRSVRPAEGSTRIDPVALGRVLGLDRAPEVKTIRRKIRALAEAGVRPANVLGRVYACVVA